MDVLHCHHDDLNAEHFSLKHILELAARKYLSRDNPAST
jgi:hypothetical protein